MPKALFECSVSKAFTSQGCRRTMGSPSSNSISATSSTVDCYCYASLEAQENALRKLLAKFQSKSILTPEPVGASIKTSKRDELGRTCFSKIRSRGLSMNGFWSCKQPPVAERREQLRNEAGA